jgi:thymidine phosphorylase
VITRPADAGGKNYEAADIVAFEKREAAGEFLISWAAHGLKNGLPIELAQYCEKGIHVIANGSRAAVADIDVRS